MQHDAIEASLHQLPFEYWQMLILLDQASCVPVQGDPLKHLLHLCRTVDHLKCFLHVQYSNHISFVACHSSCEEFRVVRKVHYCLSSAYYFNFGILQVIS